MIDANRVFKDSARMIAAAAEHPVPTDVGMEEWTAYCEKVAPEHKALWQQFRKLDFAEDTERLTNWLVKLLDEVPPPANVNGLWFGLFNPVRDDGATSCQMYLGGSCEFDPNSMSNEWVCNLSYRPTGRYSKSKILDQLYRRTQVVGETDSFYLGEALLCHGYLALVISNWCHGPMKRQLLGNAAVRAIVMGHDSGDFYRIAVLRKS